MTSDVGNPGPGLGQAQYCGRVKLVNGYPNPHPLDNWISDGNTDINKRLKTSTD